MKVIPVIQLGPDNIVVVPLQPDDLLPLAKETTLAAVRAALVQLATEATSAAVLAELKKLPRACTRVKEITIDLTTAKADSSISILPLTVVQTVVIKNLAGVTATLKFGPTGESPVTILKGEVRDGFELSQLHLSSPGGPGGTVTIELQGR